MRRTALALIAACAVATSAGAQERPASPTDPAQQALLYQLQQCRAVGDQTIIGAFTVAAKLDAETKRADAEKKRADEAEAKLKAAAEPAK